MEEKEFQKINNKLSAGIPHMTDDQLTDVEVLGELSKQEQDRRFPAAWEKSKQQRKDTL